MKLKFKEFSVFFLFCVFCCLTFSGLWAEVIFSVTPFEGGSSLRFGVIDSSSIVNKEVTIRVTSTGTEQYQVLQRVLEPFTNEQGEILEINAVTSYPIRGSSMSGVLYQEDNPVPLTEADQLLYMSDSDGSSDSFRIIYKVTGADLNASGNFSGRIYYTVRPIGGGTEANHILNVYLETTGEFSLNMESSSGMDVIRLDVEQQRYRNEYVKFDFKGNWGRTLNIYQEIEELPYDELRENVSKESIRFFSSGGRNGELFYKSSSPLERDRVLIYSSEADSDEVVINFLLDEKEIERQKAGIYRGKLAYIVERDFKEQVYFVDLEIDVQPVFKLEIIFPREGMRFNEILPNSPPQEREITVVVTTNLERPYMVIQNVDAYLTNEQGKEIEPQHFTMRQDTIDNESGEIGFPAWDSVPLGDVPVFFSDNQGSSARFKAAYRLESYKGIFAGNYSTLIGFSLGER